MTLTNDPTNGDRADWAAAALDAFAAASGSTGEDLDTQIGDCCATYATCATSTTSRSPSA
jgi:hypothetical protein